MLSQDISNLRFNEKLMGFVLEEDNEEVDPGSLSSKKVEDEKEDVVLDDNRRFFLSNMAGVLVEVDVVVLHIVLSCSV